MTIAHDGPPITVRGLVKRFGTFTAVDHLELTVEPGQVHGFLGPNGAGKSTTIRTLLGLYRPDSGEARVLGLNPVTHAAQINRQVAYVPGEVALWPNFTGAQVLDALGGLRGARNRERERELIDRFSFDPTKRVRTYSKGNRQKLILIAALSAPVQLLILDEPTSGLDPLMERTFGDTVAEVVQQGVSVLLSSHILGEVERLCSHVTIIKDGTSVESGSLRELRHLAASTVTAHMDEPLPAELLATLQGWGLSCDVSEAARLECAVPRDQVAQVLGVLAAHRINDVTCTPASLEDLFLRHYEGSAR